MYYSLLGNNQLDKIKADNLFEKLPELQHLDLRRNRISRIEASAFKGAHNLTELCVNFLCHDVIVRAF